MHNLQQADLFAPEIWADIPRREGFYQISNYGRIQSVIRLRKCNSAGDTTLVQGKIRVPQADKQGYATILGYKDNKPKVIKLHRWVAKLFVPNPENKPEVNHIDGNKFNANASNLEWVTRSENLVHAYKHGLKKSMAGRKQVIPIDRSYSRKAVNQLGLNGDFIKRWESPSAAAVALGKVDIRTGITKACKNLNRTCKGYRWQFEDAADVTRFRKSKNK